MFGPPRIVSWGTPQVFEGIVKTLLHVEHAVLERVQLEASVCTCVADELGRSVTTVSRRFGGEKKRGFNNDTIYEGGLGRIEEGKTEKEG